MSEIPELPRFTPLSRPLPPGGLEQAVQAGRHRRNRFLGAAGGSTTALVLLVALVTSSPDQRDDSLRSADPEASASASAAPEPSTAPEPEESAAAEPAADPAASPGPNVEPEPESEPGEPESTGPPAPEERQPDGQVLAVREPFVEEPREHAAPATCQGAPDGLGASTSCGGNSTANSRGSRATARLSYCVPFQQSPIDLHYDGGREHEVKVYRGEGGPLLYTFSQTVSYTQGAHTRRVQPGRCLEWTGEWDGSLMDGSRAAPGEYWIMVTLEPDQVNDWPRGEAQGGGIGFGFTLTEE
jgi:hypothetical protein